MSLDMRITSRIAGNKTEHSPKLPMGDPGLKIGVTNVAYDAGEARLTFQLHLTYAIPQRTWKAYRDPLWAVNLTVEDTGSADAGAVALKDPFVKFEGDRENLPNLQGKIEPGDSPVQTSWAHVPMEVRVQRSPSQPSVFVKTAFREHTSNTLAINLDDLSVVGA